VPISTPTSAIHTLIVSADKASGSPPEKPSSSTTPTRALK